MMGRSPLAAATASEPIEDASEPERPHNLGSSTNYGVDESLLSRARTYKYIIRKKYTRRTPTCYVPYI